MRPESPSLTDSTMRPPMEAPTREAGPLQPMWHTISVDAAENLLVTDTESGLTTAEARHRLKAYGENTILESDRRSWKGLLLHQFTNILVLLLQVAATVAFAIGEVVEAVSILCVILLNALIGFFTEWRAEETLAALKKAIVPVAHVVRNGNEVEIPAAELVPGDLVALLPGNRVPADGRIIEAQRLNIEEAPLTGESSTVIKCTDPLFDPRAPVAERECMAFLGTTVMDGHGWMLVTATGGNTEVGQIGSLIAHTTAPTTPLERQLHNLGRSLVGVVLALCAVVVAIGWLRGHPFLLMLEVGISLAIAAVPEGLPAVATMTLALGMRRMAHKKALVRHLPAVETLGSTTVICSDKTGTLTRNEMTVRTYQLDDERIEVTGMGYHVQGDFFANGAAVNPVERGVLRLALEVGALCSDTVIDRSGDSPVVLGDPTEAALVVAAEKGHLSRELLLDEYPRIGEIPFDSVRKRMVTVHRKTPNGVWAAIKGAPGVITASCRQKITASGIRPFTEEDRGRFLKFNDELAGQQLRILALAYKEVPDGYTEAHLTDDFVFIGLVGIHDPLRAEAKEAIAQCQSAGIRTVMITGDQQATAADIARQLGLDRAPDGTTRRVVHGRELVNLDRAGWSKVVSEASVFARVSPEHKLRIVEALQGCGEVVAMTGDGINDAPALKKADIGIAMGIKGTEVAKEASSMIITDDNFATIVAAVEQGRTIYGNIVRFVHYLFSCNGSEILVVSLSLIIGWPLPLFALQVLWLNLITDVFPALALALERTSPDVMQRPPRRPSDPIFTTHLVCLVVVEALMLTAVTLFSFWLGLNWYGSTGAGLSRAMTLSFMTLALAQVFHVFNVRSMRRSVFTEGFFTNGALWGAIVLCVVLQLAAVHLPFLQSLLHTAPLGLHEWVVVVGASITPMMVMELMKFCRRCWWSV